MQTVLTLISPTSGGLSNELVKLATDFIRKSGATTGAPDWLSEGQACDIEFSGPVSSSLETGLRTIFSSKKIDLVLQPTGGRRKKLLLSDMDSTIVTSETLDEMAQFAGLKEQISKITARAMNGEIRFRDALLERVTMLKGLSSDTLAATMQLISYAPGARTLVKTMAANGAYTALVSGGFTYFTERVSQVIGFDMNAGVEIEILDGKLTGNIVGEIVTKDIKRDLLIRLAKERGIDIGDTLAVGDGANDLPMLKEAGMGVAYHAKPIVIASAPLRIDHAGLDALLFMQGYRREEFVG